MVMPCKTTISHWNYFLSLEDDIFGLSRFIELHSDNYCTYSLELAKVLFAAASEIDVVAKQLCNKQDSQSNAGNIVEYRRRILSAYPEIKDAIVYLPQFGLTLTPWEQWKTESPPVWWKAYNNVKHHRHTHFSEASLKNALDSLAALFVLLLFFYREEARTGQLHPDSRLFVAGEPFTEDRLMWDERSKVYLLNSDPRI